jgi:cysteine desulfurase
MRPVYLDYNASTPVGPSVVEAMQPFLTRHFGNPSSDHTLGRECHFAIEEARDQVAALLGADCDEIVFTSCGTESNNLALKGVLWRYAPHGTGHLVISAIEHPGVSAPARALEREGHRLSIVPCDAEGVVSAEAVANLVREETTLVSIMHANNETGAIQPIQEIAARCHAQGVLVHTDAAQSVGKIPTNVGQLGVDLLSVAGHKFCAPKGIGALYIRRGVDLEPVLHGAPHESGLRPGTENVASIVGLGRAAELARRAVEERARQWESLRDRLWARLRAAIGPELTQNAAGAPRLPNTLNVNFPRVAGAELLRNTPEICASTGAACHSGESTIPATLAAMGLPPPIARGAVRLSLGWQTTRDDIDRASDVLIHAWERLVGP